MHCQVRVRAGRAVCAHTSRSGGTVVRGGHPSGPRNTARDLPDDRPPPRGLGRAQGESCTWSGQKKLNGRKWKNLEKNIPQIPKHEICKKKNNGKHQNMKSAKKTFLQKRHGAHFPPPCLPPPLGGGEASSEGGSPLAPAVSRCARRRTARMSRRRGGGGRGRRWQEPWRGGAGGRVEQQGSSPVFFRSQSCLLTLYQEVL